MDSGCGVFCDHFALLGLAELDEDTFFDILVEAPDAPVPGLVPVVADVVTGANLVVVTSGWGDGAYPTLIGYTADGELAGFVTDFCVVPQ